MTGTFDNLSGKMIAFVNSILSGNTGDIIVTILGMLLLAWIIYAFRHAIFGSGGGKKR
jgi:hypothetical protein